MIFDSVDLSLSSLSKSIIFPNFLLKFIIRFDQIPKDLSKIPYFSVDSTLIYQYTIQFMIRGNRGKTRGEDIGAQRGVEHEEK